MHDMSIKQWNVQVLSRVKIVCEMSPQVVGYTAFNCDCRDRSIIGRELYKVLLFYKKEVMLNS